MNPVAVPERSTWVMGLADLACGGYLVCRRRISPAIRRACFVKMYCVGIAGVAAMIATPLFAEPFDSPSATSLTSRISGTTPSGLLWESVATGNVMTAGGAPGAVAFFNVDTGQLQFQNHGLPVTIIAMTYTSGSLNTTGTTPGPFVVSVGGSRSWTPYAGTSFLIYPTKINGSSTQSSFHTPFSFPADLVASGSVTGMLVQNFRVFVANPSADVLGYGTGRCVFQYTVAGMTGTLSGPVIPVTAVPEPSTYAMALAGVALGGLQLVRRRRARGAATETTLLVAAQRDARRVAEACPHVVAGTFGAA